MKENIDFSYVDLQDGFWKKRYELNRDVSIKAVYERFKETGRIDTLLYHYQDGDMVDVYFDSDTAKWIEAVAYLIEKNPKGFDFEQQVIDQMADAIEKNQTDGYINSCFQQVNPQQILKNRLNHELYNMGHLIESAIAYDHATGKHKLLACAKKAAKFIERVFVTEKSAAFLTDGHEEIELALIRLFRYTGDKAFLNTAVHFLDVRGTQEEPRYDFAAPAYDQTDKPVREIDSAEGHAVRAVYLYIAMAEAAAETGDKRLLAACERVFDNLAQRRVYVTGGIGSSRIGEAFTSDYDLPNLYAYSESCAAIGLLLFCLSMQRLRDDVKYAEMIERILYNNLLSSTSLSGKAFFYENPLEVNLAEIDKEAAIAPASRTQLPLSQRKEVFGCSCCPGNINRIFARIGDVFYAQSADTLYINQFAASTLQVEGCTLQVVTDFPLSGAVEIRIDSNHCFKKLKIRKPTWCDEVTFAHPHTTQDGYLVVEIGTSEVLRLDFSLVPCFIESNPKVWANAGRVALTYGPIVYCLEGVDNPNVFNCAVDASTVAFAQSLNPQYGLYELTVDGFCDAPFEGLYQKYRGKQDKTRLKFVPYFTFANRGASDMQVWVRKK